ncbi:MAG: DUF1549 and DUF1553 domain-containing protein, partial [Gemmatales bacterium]|nr:DUF1549 and DUF1553 domain-containing protein [Gemmatales bacterium]
APLADDATFLRRIYLDLVGTIPSAEEVQVFLRDYDPDKRAKWIDRLLADPRYAQHQANVWDVILFGRNPPGGDATRKRDGFKRWLAGKFATNTRYDALVRSILLAEEEGSELFYVQFRNQPEEATVAVSRIFLGTQLQCARCHDHPFEDWTQRDFYGMAGFFVRLVVLEEGSGNARRFRIAEKSSGEVLFSGNAKDQVPGRKGEPVKPKFLLGPELDEPPLPKDYKEVEPKPGQPLRKPFFSRKEKIAQWITASDNPFFARAAANRFWGQFFGRGLVHPVDDLGSNKSSAVPGLLDTVAQEFVAHGFDVKWLIRELVSTRAYQLASSGPVSEASPRFYERARVRPLSAEELLAAIQVATGFDRTGEKLPGDTQEYFLRYFGEPTNGQGEFQGSLSEHLFLNNSGNLRQMIQPRKGNLAQRLLIMHEPWDKRVELLFLSVLSRYPSEAERSRFVQHLTSPGRPEALLEEAIWVLLNTAEFRFNH